MMKMDGSPATRTLVIAPHMDDEVLGAGGLIRKRVCCQQEVMVLTMFDRKYPFEQGNLDDAMKKAEIGRRQAGHFDKAMEVLGYKQVDHRMLEEGEPHKIGYYKMLEVIEHYLRVWHPTEVVIPGRYDLNQDHRYLNEVCRIALRPGNRCPDKQQGPIKRCLEMISHDRYGSCDVIDAGYGVAMTDQMLETVVKAWRCYEDEQREHPHPRSVENMWARWKFFGSQFGFAYAEPFRLLFEIE